MPPAAAGSLLRQLGTGDPCACPVTSQLVWLLSFPEEPSLSGLAQARFSPPHSRPLCRDFARGGASGERVPRGVYTRVHGRLKREGTKHWMWKVASLGDRR